MTVTVVKRDGSQDHLSDDAVNELRTKLRGGPLRRNGRCGRCSEFPPLERGLLVAVPPLGRPGCALTAALPLPNSTAALLKGYRTTLLWSSGTRGH